jgi:aspartate kinase
VVLNIHSNKKTRAHGFLASVFSILDKWHLSIDLLASSEVHVSMALHADRDMLTSVPSSGAAGTSSGNASPIPEEELRIQDERLDGAVRELAELGNVDIAGDMAIISVIGKHLKRSVGLAGRMFSVLGDAGINLEMISQGASEINISCVIFSRDADRALNVLHTNLFTFFD